MNTVQSLIDDPSNSFRFILTGSSARKLKRRGGNLLPGRIILEHMDPFIHSEVRDSFDLARALQEGMLPGIYLGGKESIATLDNGSLVLPYFDALKELARQEKGGQATPTRIPASILQATFAVNSGIGQPVLLFFILRLLVGEKALDPQYLSR